MKKASGKSKGKTKKPAKKKHLPKSKKPVDLVEVRKEITNLVGSEATQLAQAVVEEARKGQLAPVKYLFEVAGLYPAPEELQAKPEEAGLAKTLLHRLGLPLDPVIQPDDDPAMKQNLSAARLANAGAEEDESGNSDSQPEKRNTQSDEKDVDEDDDVAVLAGSIP
jgi:hypothetical protein